VSTSSNQLEGLLKATSRSFYLTLRVLPARIRPQIGMAYLLARAADTIADTEIVPLADRLIALQNLRERILGAHDRPLEFGELAGKQGAPAERLLLERCDEAIRVMQGMHPLDQQKIHEVLAIITSGQELDLKRFAGASEKNIMALESAPELDDYTYRVAGCVGEFWTRMCRAHLFRRATLDMDALLAKAVRFGKGLQLVNILRDVPADLRQGRCYLPADELTAAGLSPMDLRNPGNTAKFRPVYDGYLAMAEHHLAAGWEYTNTLPARCVRVRLACAWPILIGMQTLAKLREGNVLDPAQRIKISRSEVKKVILRSVLCYPLPVAWRRLFAMAGGSTGKAVA
jgi:farnesyl-diphosphate farnesyltransferase